jgi:hypothetical protein
VFSVEEADVAEELMRYLRGVEVPVSVPEAVACAQANGAPGAVLRYLESLPAAVFTSEEAMHGVLSSVSEAELEMADPEETEVGVDGYAG